MRISPVITKLTTWASIHCLAKYICLTFFLCTAVACANQSLTAQDLSTQPKEMEGNGTISGTLGIKFGEDINPYLEGHYAREDKITPDMGSIPDNAFRYKKLKPPIDVNKMFPDAQNLELLGISDDKNRVIEILLKGNTKISSCEKNGSVTAIRKSLREKYKITKPQRESGDLFEEYGDSEGNKIWMHCSSDSFHVTYTSRLMSEYIARLRNVKEKQKEVVK